MKEVIQRQDKAVSPIIATILLIAITVVLAATLYTILGGYTTFLGASTPTASVQVTNSSTSTLPFYFVYVEQFGGNVSLNSVQLRITEANNSIYVVPLAQGTTSIAGGLWNLTVRGSSYLSASTAMTLQGNKGLSPLPFIVQIQLIDLKTNGVISTNTVQ
ncbi:hypothetical protein IX51_07670 [uncultured archaeon]|nr:hypothetical protein IX51_07670 [uncultured archaeon]